MTEPFAAVISPSQIRDKIIVALDVDSAAEAKSIADELRGRVGAVKVGLQLFVAAGPDLVRELVENGHKVFLDLKFHDIPNTVAKAAIEAVKLGVWMFNVHAAGGSEMMKQTADVVAEASLAAGTTKPILIGVTVLTSSDRETLSETGVFADTGEQVVKLARLAHSAGLDGVVASPREVVAIRAAIADRNFITVTPGIRRMDATADDQKRVTTLGRALKSGTDYAVIGRPIIRAADRIAAVEDIVAEAAATI